MSHSEKPSTKIIFLGDSLTEGFQLSGPDQAFPALVCRNLAAKYQGLACINSGVSGNTSRGLLSRLDWALKSNPAIAVVSIGSNDGLRGIPVEETEKNLRRIVQQLKSRKIKVLLTGQKMPPNYGKEFQERFEKVFEIVAKEEKVPIMPFLLDGVAGQPKMNLADGIHPNPDGHRRIADRLQKHLEPLL